MKLKLFIATLIVFISFNFQCSNDEQPQVIQQGCECRKMFYTQQVVNYGIQFVYTHRGDWELVDCSIKESGTLNTGGYLVTGFYVIDETHNYKWECKNQQFKHYF